MAGALAVLMVAPTSPSARDTDSAGVTVHIEITPVTDEQHRLAASALAELINQ